YIASTETTLINITNIGLKTIGLSVHNSYGCVFNGNIENVEIKEADFVGAFEPDDEVNICEDEPFSGISFTQTGGTSVLEDIIWMRGNQQAGTGLSFVPEHSGPYWGILIDEDGCRFPMPSPIINVTVRKRPFVDIVGDEFICADGSTVLKGVVPSNPMKRQWFVGTSPAVPVTGPHGVMSTTTPLILEVSAADADTYTLVLEPVDDATCGSSVEFTVAVHPAVTVPELDYEVVLCEPYTVNVWITNPQTPELYN